MNILETTIKAKELFSGFELCRLQEQETQKLIDRLENKKITIAVIGQFKRGKTTLINTILGEKLLPVGIVPITAAITRIEYAEPKETFDTPSMATVYFTNGLSQQVPAADLHMYISEQENRDNERGVAEVELQTNADFLKDGLTLVDTPGVGSVHENNSKSAMDFARESDGVIFMISVDSPLNQIEVDFLRKVRRFAGKFYFVVNKIDRVDEEELDEYLDYCRDLIVAIMELDEEEAEAIRLLPVSARKDIGVTELTGMIREDLITRGAEIMERSVGLKLLEILNNTRSQIASYREVLKMAPNVFNRRFREMQTLMEEQRQQLELLPEGQYLQARINEEKALLTRKVRELFGIEYYYYVDRDDAAERMDAEEYRAEMTSVYDELETTINSIFMYKEQNAYAVARRIEDLNILMQQMRKLTRQIERELAVR
ncbi:MAG: dynamin family protein [Clostridia bacterium]|nr:dynamin family protein [Clostridia bacterium]